jgi:hypothetical protein
MNAPGDPWGARHSPWQLRETSVGHCGGKARAQGQQSFLDKYGVPGITKYGVPGITDGAFSPAGWFVAFPRIDLYVLEHLFRHRVLEMLLRERRIDEAVIRTLLGWRHSGFSLHNEVRIGFHSIRRDFPLDSRLRCARYSTPTQE